MSTAVADAAPLFDALGDANRLRIVTRLADDGPSSTSQVAQGIPVTRQAVTKHLTLLADGGLVSRRREGLRRYYAVADDAVFTLCDAVCASVLAHLDSRVEVLRRSATPGT